MSLDAPPVDMDSPEMTKRRRSTVVWVVSLACIGMIFDGYDLVVYGAVLPVFLEPNGLAEGVTVDAATGGLLGSYALFGMLFGALIAGTLSDRLGRRKVLLFSFAWLSIGMFVTALMSSVGGFGLFRFLTGLAVGSMVATVGPIVAEVAPPGKKNLCNALVYSGVPLGSLLSALLAIFLLPLIGWRGMFMIGALPLVTLLPLAYFKMPESVAWLASQGRMAEAHRLSEKTGLPVPAPVRPAADTTTRSRDERSSWAGLFTVYLVPTILLGLVAAMSLTLVYSLNTWLPALMQPVMGQNASLSLLLVLNGGAILGALFGSRFADNFGPQRVVASCFLIGAIAIGLVGVISATLPDEPGPGDIAGLMLALTLVVIAFAGVGTSGTQTLLYGLIANYYRTNVRGAGVAWGAGFGRLGGVGGPILGGFLAVAFVNDLHMIFYILALIAVAGMIFLLLTPKPKREAVEAERLDPTVAPSPAAVAARADKPRLYDTIMVVVDETGNQLTRDRVSEFVYLTGHQVHLVYLAPERVIGGEVSGLVDGSDVDIDPEHVANLQEYVNMVSQRGIPATGKVLSATLFGRGDAVVGLAEQLHADLVILNTEEGGQRAKAQLAEEVANKHPKMAVLIARSTRDLPAAALS